MILNLTPHTINIFAAPDAETPVLVLESCTKQGQPVPRCRQESVQVGTLDGIPVFDTHYSEVIDLPPRQDGVFLVVNRLVLEACPDRDDLLSPGTGIRDAEGRICGAFGLAR